MPAPTGRFNYDLGLKMIASEDIPLHGIVVPNGIYGTHMTCQLADNRDPDLARGQLWIAKHATPGPKDGEVITASHHGMFHPWYVAVKGVDTRNCELHQPVYLGTGGTWTFEPPDVDVERRIIGKVLRVGPASPSEEGSPTCGAILFHL